MPPITLHTRKLYDHGYRGFIRVPQTPDNMWGYMVSSPIVRVTKDDALRDARDLREDLLTENGVKG